MSNEFDAAVATSMQPDTAQAARLGFSIAADTNPDAYAEAQRVARRTGVPVDTALNLPKEMKLQDRVGSIDFDALTQTSPSTATLLSDIEKAKVAHDDVDNLSKIESTLYSIGKWEVGTAKAIASSAMKFNEGAWGVARAGAELLPDAIGAPLAGKFAEYGQGQRAMAARLMPQTDNLVESSWYSGMQSLGLNLMQLPLGIGGKLTPVLTSMGLTTGGQAYGEARDKGVSKNEARAFGTSQGIIEAGTEMIGMPALFSMLKPGQFGAKAIEYLIKEQGGEQIATHLQDLNEWAVLHPEKNFSDYLAERPTAALQTALATAFSGGGQVVLMKGAQMMAQRGGEQAQQAEQGAAFFANLNQLAEASKVLQRDPETFASFIEQAAENGPVPDVFINAQTLQQSGMAEQLAAVSPAVAEQLQVALDTGGDIRIPVAEYATAIAPTEYAQALVDHLKVDPEGMSRAEAQEYLQSGQAQQLQAEVDRIITGQLDDSAFKQSVEIVRADIKAQLDAAARFTQQVNDAYASMVGNFYAVQAARIGITPEAMFQRFPLRIGAESVAGQQFEQAQGPFGPVLTDFKGDTQGAIAKLKEMKSGEAIGALHHPDIGDIDLVWGQEGTGASDGYGLAKLAKYHPEVLDDLQGIISAMKVTTRSENRVNLESEDHRAGVRLTWDNQAKHWLMTAFQKKGGGGDATRTDTSDLAGKDDTASLADASDGIVDQKLNEFHQQARGSFNPATLQISLLKNADLSTFLHESGHFFLEVQADLAGQLMQEASIHGMDTLKPGELQVLKDMQAVLDWFGIKDLNEWNALDFEEKRSYHEQFARGFEAYLFEGTTPSIELQGVFQRFRAWLLNVYRDLKALNVELTDEVRSVFDRMLASTEQINLAEQGRSMMPLFTSAEQAGMTPEEFAAYQALGIDASNDAIQELQARGLRDMQWLHNARGRVIKQLQKQSKEIRTAVQMGVRREVMAMPIYQAWNFLTGKAKAAEDEVVEDENGMRWSAHGKFDISGLEEIGLPVELVNHLKALRMTSKDGLHADLVAEMFGFSSGDELTRTLAAAEAPKEVIEAMTDLRMLEQFGDLSSQEAIERAADKAIHNDARARMVATEANALAKATGQRKVLAEAAKQYAAALIARLKVRSIKPSQYASAEVRAAKAAEQASKAGDLATAAAEKRNQLINTYATKAAYAAQEEIDAGLRYLKKFDGEVKGLDVGYLDQIASLLERFDLRKGQSLRAIDKRTALSAWLDSQREAGFEPDIPADLINEAYRTSYKNLTVEEFRGLVDTVKQIEHLGRLKKKLLTAKDQREYEVIRDEIATSIELNAGNRQADTRTPDTVLGKALLKMRQFWASHIKSAMWARIMDGGRDGGPMWEYFVRAANERGDMETTLRAEATAKLSEILDPVFKAGKLTTKAYFPSIKRSLTREGRIAIALNWGNEGNRQRLLGGEGWTPAQVQPVLESLTAEELQAVQAIWDHFESYRPEIGAKEKRVYGREPEWVAPSPFIVSTKDGQQVTLRGGYYPIKYDPMASQRAEEHADAESAQRQLKGAYTSATTRRSFTKSRAEEVSGRPLLYSLAGVYSGVNDVIHDLAWHEWLIDTNRLLRSQTIDRAIRNHYGPEVKAQFKKWSEDIAEGDKASTDAGDIAVNYLRQSVSVAGLGFNVVSAAMQPLGITQSIVRVGAQWVGRGVSKYIAHPVRLTREVNEMSEFMANRARTRNRELNELRNQVEGQTAVKEFVGKYAYFLMMRFQQAVDVPTWWGAYEKAVAEGNDDDRAIALADQAVVDAQGGGMLKDQAGIERTDPKGKLFTVFYSFMNTALNLGVATGMTEKSRAKQAADYALLYVIPPLLAYALKAALTPGDSGDDDPEKIAKKLLAAQIDYLMGMMVYVRELSDVAKTLAGANDLGRDYQGPAGLRLVADAGKFAHQVAQGDMDDSLRKSFVNIIGDLFGLPSAQINRTITGVKAIHEGKTDNPAAIAFGFQEKR